MRLLLDTHCLLWAVYDEERLSAAAREIIEDAGTTLFFSVVSVIEMAIKRARNRADFMFEPERTRRELLDVDYIELAVSGGHALHLRSLPLVHRDPFDRLLVAQAIEDDLTLMTADVTMSRYAVKTISS